MRPYLILATALILLIAQATVVCLALFAPHVPAEYRAVFIDHTREVKVEP